MANTFRKILGQKALSATTLTDVYTVSAGTQSEVSSVIVTNLSATPCTFRISVSNAGTVDNVKQYIYYDVTIPGNETFDSQVGLMLAGGDVIRGYTTGANITMSVFGTEFFG